jgi:hypothetical protein
MYKYHVGDEVVVTCDEPYMAPLKKGAEVKIIKVEEQAYDDKGPRYIVTHGKDEWALHGDVIAGAQGVPLESFLNDKPQEMPSNACNEVPLDNNPKARLGALKVPTHFVPPIAQLHLATAMADGARKYGPFNWREEPVSATTYKSAIDRHLAAWFDGEDTAKDSKCHHLAHVMACCALILDSEALGILNDDRPPEGPSADFLENYWEAHSGKEA